MYSHKKDHTNETTEALEIALQKKIDEEITAEYKEESRSDMDEIVATLVIIRKRKKMSQSAVAQACNVHRNSICRLESFTEAPSLKMVLKYADCLGMRLVLAEK